MIYVQHGPPSESEASWVEVVIGGEVVACWCREDGYCPAEELGKWIRSRRIKEGEIRRKMIG